VWKRVRRTSDGAEYVPHARITDRVRHRAPPNRVIETVKTYVRTPNPGGGKRREKKEGRV